MAPRTPCGTVSNVFHSHQWQEICIFNLSRWLIKCHISHERDLGTEFDRRFNGAPSARLATPPASRLAEYLAAVWKGSGDGKPLAGGQKCGDLQLYPVFKGADLLPQNIGGGFVLFLIFSLRNSKYKVF